MYSDRLNNVFQQITCSVHIDSSIEHESYRLHGFIVVNLALNNVLLLLWLSDFDVMMLVLLKLMRCVGRVAFNEPVEISFGTLMCWSGLSVATKNRFCGNGVASVVVVGDVINRVGLCVEVISITSASSPPNDSLSFGWIASIPVVSNVSVGFTNSSVCVLGRSLASGKLIFN